MQWQSLNELRKKYIDFFKTKHHKYLKSFSLVPQNDLSLLLINSGMAPMKKFFTGETNPPSKRVVTCQKCIRTPDIDRVGITSRHITFFEMLGNFSFGDYFKSEVIPWAWEFCTDVLKMPEDKLWISIYKDDMEAYDIWTKKVLISPSRIVKLDKADNFWEHGIGPCGPCSEIYFDRGEQYGCGSLDCSVGCDCDRYVEFWNLVFTQFFNDGNGNYSLLKHPNIDTGMGLERLACIIQGVDNVFLVDTIKKIMNNIADITSVTYGQDKNVDISLKVITDHIRSAVFMLADGIIPSNEGRGYVLRRILRRASRYGTNLGKDAPFLHCICETVISQSKDAYPELEQKQKFIEKIVLAEETNFKKTIKQGLHILNDLLIHFNSKKVIPAKEVFKLSDTYGFPVDLTREILSEKNMTFNEDEYHKLLSEQKNKARNARESLKVNAWENKNINLENTPKTRFVGYQHIKTNSTVLLILKNNKKIDSASPGDRVTVILDSTPMYAQGGGQVGDTGEFIFDSSIIAQVLNTTKDLNGIIFHDVIIKNGSLSVGSKLLVHVNQKRRDDIMRNHTAAHILQAALRKVLGEHVEQAGQLVNESYVRFDFTHFSPLTTEDISKVECLVNNEIFKNVDVLIQELPIEQAKKMGAIALFGEKYSDIVRVVQLEDNFSIELCAGTHVKNTSQLGMFKIISEKSVAAGVRRIQALTGENLLHFLNKHVDAINKCASIMSLKDTDTIVQHCNKILLDIKRKDQKIRELQNKLLKIKTDNLKSQFETFFQTKLIVKHFDDMDSQDLKTIADNIKSFGPDVVAVIAGTKNGKATLIAIVGDSALKLGIHAGNLIKSISKIAGGNGGGKANFAMAGINDITKINQALQSVKEILKNMIF